MTTPISGNINGVKWNGDYWLAYGQSPNIAKSYDGINWRSTKTNFSVVSDIKWNGTLWVAVGFITTADWDLAPYPGLIKYSTDGKTWTTATTDLTTLENAQGWALLAVEIHDTTWLAVGYSGNTYLFTIGSTNGTSWTKNSQPTGTLSSDFFGYRPTILWNNVSWVVNAPYIRTGGSTIYSGNPIVQKGICAANLTNLIYNNGIYLGLEQFDAYTGNLKLYYSTNLTSALINITARTGLSSIQALLFNGETWLVFDQTGNVAINTAPSRTSNWTKQTDNAKKLTFVPTKINWFHPYWVATNATKTAKSSDGITWVNQTLRMNNPVYNGNYLLSYLNDTLEKITLWEKTAALHSPPGPNILAPIYINLVGNPITTLTDITLNTPRQGVRLRLENIVNNTTGIKIVEEYTSTNTNLKQSISIFTIRKGNSVTFGLIVLEYIKNGKWFTLSYLKNKTYLI